MNYPQVGIYFLTVNIYLGGSSILLMHSPPEREKPHPETEYSYSAPQKPIFTSVGSGGRIVAGVGSASGTSEVTGKAPTQ